MLDFYFIRDEQTKPNYSARDLELAGSLDVDVFERLIWKGVIDTRFDYYSNFRWSIVLLNQIRQNIEQKQLLSDTDVKYLLQLINPALAKQSGLIAFGD